MKKTYLLVTICLLLALLPLTAMAETLYVNTPNGGSVNLREGPSSDDAILTSVPFGAAVEVIDYLLGGTYVNVNYNGYYGFISQRYLTDYQPMPGPLPTYVPAPTVRPTVRPTARPNNPTAKPHNNTLEGELNAMFAGFVASAYEAQVVPSTPTTYVNLRWAPSKSAPVRSQFWAGTTLHVISENGAWSEVYDVQNNIHGFMMTNFLKPVSYGVDGSDS